MVNQQGSNPPGNNPPSPNPPPPAQKKRVQIVCEETGVVGTKLLRNGDITDDPEYVAMLKDGRGLVREVK
jgi:hypothetical protein